jgi:hypothetical protein
MEFDPKKTDVFFFINRVRIVANQEGNQPVLDVLPFCLKGRALEWHTSLPPHTIMDLNRSLDLWCACLEREFKRDPLEARRTARQLTFSFGTVDTMSLADYLQEKLTLLQAAGTFDVETIKTEMWEGLDPKLAMLVRPIQGESVDTFRQRTREAESGARREWEASRWDIRPRQTYGRQRDPPSDDRIRRLVDSLRQPQYGKPQAGQQHRSTLPPPTAQPQPLQSIPQPRSIPKRPCRHCGQMHWDADCPQSKGQGKGQIHALQNLDLDLDEQDTATLLALAEADAHGSSDAEN